jgi:ribosomal VAR1-like protein
LSYIKSDTGKVRHFTPAAQEWYNSIYTYDTNYLKTLPVANKNLMSLLRSFFNLQLNLNLMQNKTKRLLLRFRRVSTKKVFIGRGDVKHTSNKVLITFYVLNTEGMLLSQNYEKAKKEIFYPRYDFKKSVKYSREGKPIIKYNRPLSWEEIFFEGDHTELYDVYTMSIINKYANYTEIELLNSYYEHLASLVETNLLTVDEKRIMFLNKISSWNPLEYLKFNQVKFETVKHFKEKKLRYFFHLLKLNSLKFTNQFMSKLIYLVRKLYNKEVEFNIVKLKKMHLNSDIYTQVVSLKLRNRNNKLYRVLKTSLRKIKLPVIRKISERISKPNKEEFFVNRIRNNIISCMFKDNNDKDSLNNLLLSFYPAADDLEINIKKRSSSKKKKISLKGFVIRHQLKHLKLRGIRVEAKGRLTRRATASRSVFKMKWLGGLKNVDSSFRGLSTIMLRGYHKSNVQYTIINSKNRNGAYGVKGWVSSK